ncbi:hypothetical protein D3C78_1926210 [compost metagenome]
MHIDGTAEGVLADLLAVDVGSILTVTRGVDDGVESGESHQRDDDADDGLGNPPL